MVDFSDIKKKDTLKKAKKPYEPIEFEVLTVKGDVLAVSTFDTKGMYDFEDGWGIIPTEELR